MTTLGRPDPLGTIAELVEVSAAKSPGSPAVTAVDGSCLSYAELVDVVRSIGGTLRGAGVGREDCVAVAVPNGPSAAAVSLAIACSSSCAPLNPVHTELEAGLLLDDLGAVALVVTSGHEPPALSAARQRGLVILEAGPTSRTSPELHKVGGPNRGVADDELAPRPSDVALRLHTSGTTAAPKQVPLSHANLSAAAQAVVRSLALDENDRCLNVMPLFHSHGFIGAFLSTMAAGGVICCAPGFDPRRFITWARQCDASWYTAAPTIHQGVIGTEGDWPGWRFARSASAPLPPSVAEALEARLGAPLIEVYGMTEAYQIAANPLPPGERRFGTVGFATGTEIAVLSEGGLVERGAGEIVVRGPNVFAGYASPPGANDDAFVEGWFRTGDLGVLDDGGYLRITGRLKELVNRAGEKISPREVDEALLQHPSIADAACFSVPDQILGEDIAAAIVLTAGTSLDEPALRHFLGDRIAPFKVPRRFVVVENIPTTTGGKRSRRMLTERLGERVQIDRAGPSAAPSTSDRVHDRLGNIWTAVLGLDHSPSDDDRFFDLGGTSLDVLELVVRIEAQFGVDLPINDVIDLPTLSAMATGLQARIEGRAGTSRNLQVMRAAPGPGTVVLVPGAHGNAIGLQPMADHVHPGARIFSFRYPGHIDGETPLRSIDDLAIALLSDLHAVDAASDVVFYGNSLGAWIVFEAARRLSLEGNPVRGVVLGDMYCPTMAARGAPRRPPLPRRVSRKALNTYAKLRRRAQAARPGVPSASRRNDAVLRASNHAQRTYEARSFPGAVTLVAAEERRLRLGREDYGWSDVVAGKVTVRVVSGEHDQLHANHALFLAACVNEFFTDQASRES